MRNIFHNFLGNVLGIFSGRNLLWHGAAIFLTFLIVYSGLDWEYFLVTQKEFLQAWFFPAVVIGGILPMILPVVIFAVARIRKNFILEITAYLLVQAAFLGWLISSFYKSLTGRIPPPHHFGHGSLEVLQGLVDISQGFQFGILRGGIFWGWPSSHTTVAFSTGIALWYFFPNKKIIRALALVYPVYMAFGVSITGVHWFSEAMAAAIIGSVIGAVIGKSFHVLKLRERQV